MPAAPITVSRNLLLTPVEGGAAAAAESASIEWVAPPKVKRAQPEHKFKFRNCVAGFYTAGPGATAEAVAAAAAAASVAKPQPAAAVESSPESAAKKPKLDKEKRSKKRKSDVDGTPSKKKKKE